MDEKSKDLSIRMKGDSKMVRLLMLLMMVLVIGKCFSIGRMMQKAPSDFTVTQKEGKYVLFIEKEEKKEINYNDYATKDEAGNTNYRMSYIRELVTSGMTELCLCAFLILCTLFFQNVVRSGRPFEHRNTRYLQIMACILVLTPFAVGVARMFVDMAVFSKTQFTLTASRSAYFIIGATLGVISEVFHYGEQLQTDVDQII